MRTLPVIAALAASLAGSPVGASATPDQSGEDICAAADTALRQQQSDEAVQSQVDAALMVLAHDCPGTAALRFLERASAAGNAEANFALGALYEDGSRVAQDQAAANAYYRKAAGAGHVQAQHRLGVRLLGETKAVDQIEEGLYWLGAAANQGDGFSAAVIGLLHARGMRGVKSDPCLALAWFDASELMGAPLPLQDLRSEAADLGNGQC